MTEPTFDARLDRCPLCASSRIGAHDRDSKGIVIDRCADCALMFMNPQYTERYLQAYYAGYITDEERGGREAARKRRQKEAAFDLIARHRSASGRFLAVGCGGGLELEIARERGFEAEGYDVDPVTTAQVSARLGLPVYSGDFDDLKLPGARYACVFADQMLEHPKNPADYLRRFLELLAPDGVLYLGVPNLASFSARLKTVQGKLGLKNRTRGSHYDTDHHLFHYTPAALRRLLGREFGYDVLAVAGDPRVEISPGRYRLARRHPALCSRLAVVARPAVAGGESS